MSIKFWNILGAILTFILGSLLHFTYDLSNQNALVGLFSATNESVWEHLKLLAIPIILFTIIGYFIYGKDIENYLPIKLLSILFGMSFIVIAFYTYVGIFGKNSFWVDILIFILGVVIAYGFSTKFLDTDVFSSPLAQRLSIIGFILLIFAFIFFTVNPPDLPLFQDYSEVET